MTNMKDRLRPHREPKIKLLPKNKSINLKAKEKVNIRKESVPRRLLLRKNVNENITPVKRRQHNVLKQTSSKTAIKKSAKEKSPENKINTTKTTKRKYTKKSSADTLKSNGVATANTRKSRLLRSHTTGKTPKLKSPKKETGVDTKNNKLKESVKRPGRKKKTSGADLIKSENNNYKESESDKNSNSADGIWENAYFVMPVNGAGPVQCVDYKTAQQSSIRKISDKPRHHKCEICNKAFLGKNDLKKHSLIHFGLMPFACSQCPKRFRQAGNLRNHVASHHPDSLDNPQVFVCDYCSKQFLIKERLRLHIRIHTGFKPYECTVCPMRFARNGQMKQHLRTHTGEKNYQCDICKAMFTCKAKLKIHINRHYDIKNFTCYVCGKRFLRLDAFKKHLSCYHNDEKPFQCTICNKKLKGHLAEHMRTHNADKPHACKVCGSRFVQRSQLTVHQRIHSGARPYRCRVCWKAFAHSTALTLHTRHHTGEKPFSCRICYTPFSQLSHLKKHMQLLHGDARAYHHPACKEAFHTKLQLEKHLTECTAKLEPLKVESAEERLSRKIAESFQPSEPLMAVTKMRLLLAVLLKKICSKKKLQRLGFNKRLIDDILFEALDSSGRAPCMDPFLSAAQRLRVNVQKFLEWTVPPMFMDRFRDENKSTEELLEELTS